MGQWRAAVGLLERALALDPLSYEAHHALGLALRGVGRLDEAEGQFAAAIELYPDGADAKPGLATLLIERGELAEAAPWLRAAADCEGQPWAVQDLALLYLNLGLEAAARATLEAITTPAGAADGALASRYMAAGEYERALTFARERFASDQDPRWRPLMLLAAVLAERHEIAREQVALASPGLLRPEPLVSPCVAHEALNAACAITPGWERR